MAGMLSLVRRSGTSYLVGLMLRTGSSFSAFGGSTFRDPPKEVLVARTSFRGSTLRDPLKEVLLVYIKSLYEENFAFRGSTFRDPPKEVLVASTSFRGSTFRDPLKAEKKRTRGQDGHVRRASRDACRDPPKEVLVASTSFEGSGTPPRPVRSGGLPETPRKRFS